MAGATINSGFGDIALDAGLYWLNQTCASKNTIKGILINNIDILPCSNQLGEIVNGVWRRRRLICETGYMTWYGTVITRRSPEPRRALALVATILVAAAISGCSNAMRWQDEGTVAPRGVPAKPATSAAPASAGANLARHAAANTAVAMIGKPYRYGGSTPNGFDCSGLVQYSYASVGLKAPRTSRAQYGSAVAITLTDAEPGDLLFFSYDDKISHVAIYLGDERFVHAPSSGKQVSVASLRDPHYHQHFVRAGRLPQRE